jgi:hypothetical protein
MSAGGHGTAPEARGPAAGAGYERRDARAGSLVKWFGGLVLVIVAAFFVSRLLAGALQRAESSRAEPTHPMAGFRRPPTASVLQADPIRDLERWRAEQDALLASYGWVDRDAGIVRLPIEVAMQLWLAEHGAPPPGEEPR